MKEGIINLTRTGDGLLAGRIKWESTSNGNVANTSTVTAELELMRDASINTTSGTFRGNLTVGDTTHYIGGSYGKGLFTNLPHGKWVTIMTIEQTVSHNADGSGTCYLYAKVDGPTGTTMEGTYVTGEDTVELDKHIRYATIQSATDFTDEENPTITYSNPLGNSIYELEACISITGESADVPYRKLTKTSTSYTFNLTDDERKTLLDAAKNSKEITLKFVVRSRIAEKGDRDTDNVKATMTVVDASPVVEFSVRDINEETADLTGDTSRLIAHHSIAEVSISATPQKCATIPRNGVKITDGTTSWYKGAAFTGVISPISSGNITYTVTDSRGNQSGGGATNTFVDYFNPEVQINNVDRDTNGNLTFTVIGRAFKGSFGKESNNVGVYYRYRESDGGTLTAWAEFSNSEITWNGNEFTAEKTISGLDYSKNYNVHASITDVFHAGVKRIIVREEQLPTLPVFDWGADSFKFNVPVSMAQNAIVDLPSPTTDTEPVTLAHLQSQLQSFPTPTLDGSPVTLSYLRGLGLDATSGAPSVADLNQATTCGWYAYSDQCSNTPFNYGVVFVAKRFSTDVVQIAINTRTSNAIGERVICVRSSNGTTWSAWEYLNPPYKLGVEYPTVERHNGKVVYAKMVDLQTLPASEHKTVEFAKSTESASVVSFEVVATRTSDGMKQTLPLISDLGEVQAKARASSQYVYVYVVADLSGYTGIAKIKYTKG